MSDQENTPVAYLVTLHGQVQGIGLRKRIQRLAQEHDVVGWVRNRETGHVQAHLEGAAEAVGTLLAALQPGRIVAQIEDVVISKTNSTGYREFSIIAPKDFGQTDHICLKGSIARARLLNREFRDLSLTLLKVAFSPQNADDASLLATEIPNRFFRERLAVRSSSVAFNIKNTMHSFASETWLQTTMNRAMSAAKMKHPARIINDKNNGKNFAASLGLKIPETLQYNVRLSEIRAQPGIVVKTTNGAGSKGVYSFLPDGRILHLGLNRSLNSYDAFRKDAEEYLATSGRADRWLVEELILNEVDEPPNDLKMLTFYGKVALVQEATRMPTRVAYFDRDGRKIRTGRYLDIEFEGTGVLPEYIECAERVSRDIPLPFIRIDFLKAKEGPVFGEFTPRPGNFQDFNAATDAWLGRCYAEARGRLMADLLKGKRFVEYDAFLESLNT